ncbi:MAG: hypothetical protein FWC32_06895 [Firmicutes bacterium]|nr:hypothetical protein [Bacillota bacterium]
MKHRIEAKTPFQIIDYLPSAGYVRKGVDIEYFMGDKCEAWELIEG